MKTVPLDDAPYITSRRWDYSHGCLCEVCGIAVTNGSTRCRAHAGEHRRGAPEKDNSELLERHHLVKGFMMSGLSVWEAIDEVRTVLD